MEKHREIYSLNIPDTDKPRVVIVGGGFGGVHLLKRLKRKAFQIVLIDRYNYHTFQPLLYQVATAGLEPDAVAGPFRKIINRRRDVYFRMLSASRVDPEHHTLYTNAGRLHYDILVIATGSQINYFNNESISKHAFPMKQITHALDLRSQIFQQFEELELVEDEEERKKLMNFVVVGAGPTGVEVCGALAELRAHILPADYPDLDLRGMHIYLVEGVDRVLPAMTPKASGNALRYLEKMGVEVILNCRTEAFDGSLVKLDNHEDIHSNTLIWAAGVRGKLIGGLNSESIRKGRILVNGINRVYSDPERHATYEDIYAMGDVAFMKTSRYPQGLPGLAQVAIQQGKNLGRNLIRIQEGKDPRVLHYRNKGVLATVGRNKAIADLPGKIHLKGFPGWVVWMTVHLLSLVGFRNKLIVFTNWIWNYLTYDRGVRLILRPSTKQKDRISRAMVSEMAESDVKN